MTKMTDDRANELAQSVTDTLMNNELHVECSKSAMFETKEIFPDYDPEDEEQEDSPAARFYYSTVNEMMVTITSRAIGSWRSFN